MLKFTKEQWDSVKAARSQFNVRATAMAANAAGWLQGNSLAIPVDAWRRIDSRAQMLARSRLAVFNRLAQASTLPVSIADLVNFYPQVSDSNEVMVSMDGRNTAKADAAAVSYVGTPVPVLTTNARMGWRQMEVLRKGGGMLDVATIANGQRKMAEKMEDMVLNGLSSVNVNGATIYGLRNLPRRCALPIRPRRGLPTRGLSSRRTSAQASLPATRTAPSTTATRMSSPPGMGGKPAPP